MPFLAAPPVHRGPWRKYGPSSNNGGPNHLGIAAKSGADPGFIDQVGLSSDDLAAGRRGFTLADPPNRHIQHREWTPRSRREHPNRRNAVRVCKRPSAARPPPVRRLSPACPLPAARCPSAALHCGAAGRCRGPRASMRTPPRWRSALARPSSMRRWRRGRSRRPGCSRRGSGGGRPGTVRRLSR